MRILLVVSGNHAHVAPFVTEQATALLQVGCEVKLFCVTGHGPVGYLRNLPPLKNVIKSFSPDILHAHYGLCGLLCTLQHIVPVVVTYHGSDINDRRILPFSSLAMHRAAHNIFVSKKLQKKSLVVSRFRDFEVFSSVIPCGVNIDLFHPIRRDIACEILELDPGKHYILFAGAFDNDVKNPQLAKETFELLKSQYELKEKVFFLELKGYSRTEVALLMNAVDCLLMTSHSEGSPQVVKEALSCGCPIVSVDVGDVKELLEGVDRCHVTSNREPCFLAGLLRDEMERGRSNYGVASLLPADLDNRKVAERLMEIYVNLKKWNEKPPIANL